MNTNPSQDSYFADLFEKLSLRSKALLSIIEFENWLWMQESQRNLDDFKGIDAITAKLTKIVNQAYTVLEDGLNQKSKHTLAYFTVLADLASNYKPGRAHELLHQMAAEYIPAQEIQYEMSTDSETHPSSLFQSMNVVLFVQVALEFLLSLIIRIFLEITNAKINQAPSWAVIHSLLYKLNTIFKNTVQPALDKSRLESSEFYFVFLQDVALKPTLTTCLLQNENLREEWRELWESAGFEEQDYFTSEEIRKTKDKQVQTVQLERTISKGFNRKSRMESIHESPEFRRTKTCGSDIGGFNNECESQNSEWSFTPHISSRDLWSQSSDIKFQIPKKQKKCTPSYKGRDKGIIRRLLEKKERDESHKSKLNKKIQGF